MDSSSHRWPRLAPLTPSLSPPPLFRSSSTPDLSSLSRIDSSLGPTHSDLAFSKAPLVFPPPNYHLSSASGAYPTPPSFVANPNHFTHGHKIPFPQSHSAEELSTPQTPPIRDPLPATHPSGIFPLQPTRPPPPHLRITPPRHIIHPPAKNQRSGSAGSASSRASQTSPLDSDDTFSDIFYKPRQSLEEPFAPSSFYQQGPSGLHGQSSTDLVGPLLEDYYNRIPGGFNPAVTSTPEPSEFSLARPGHPSSLPLPVPVRPLLFSDINGPEIQPVAEPRKRKGPSFSSLKKWLPRAQEVDVERGADGMSTLADSSRRSSSEAQRVASAPTSPSIIIRSSLSSSSSALPIEMDVFSSNPFQPSYYPSPSPPKPPTPTPSLTLTSASTLYASPPISPTTATPKVVVPSSPTETIDAPYAINSSRSSLSLTPTTPTPRTRHKRGALSQRFNTLSIIEGSPNSEARFALHASVQVSPTKMPHASEVSVSALGSPDVEDEPSLHQQSFQYSWRSTASTTTPSLHGIYQTPSKGGSVDGRASVRTHSPLSSVAFKAPLDRSGADEFHSGRETLMSPDPRVLRNRHRWSSNDEDGIALASVAHGNRPVGPPFVRGHRHTNTEPSLPWKRRELVLPQLIEAGGAGSSKNRRSASVILTPSLSPTKLVVPKRKVRISTPRNTSPTFEQQQRHEIQRRLDSAIDPNPSHSSNPIFLASPDSSNGETGAPLISVIGMMFRHPLSTISLLPPAQVLFLLGFVLGPWTWLLGGWIMTPDGKFHTVDREGDIVDPSPFAKSRSATSVATSRSVREHLGSTVVGNNSTLEILDSQRIGGPDVSRASLTSQKYSHSRRIRSRASKLLLKLSGLFPLWSDSPCEWVWKCRIAALCSAAVILVAFVVACYAANHGHF